MRQPNIGPGRPRSEGLADRREEVGVDLAGDVTLEAADDLGFRLSFLRAAFDVGAGRRMRAQAGEHDPPQRVVGLPVTAGVQPVPDGLARRRRDRRGGTQVAPRRPRCAAVRGDRRLRSAAAPRYWGRSRRGRAGRARGQPRGGRSVRRGAAAGRPGTGRGPPERSGNGHCASWAGGAPGRPDRRSRVRGQVLVYETAAALVRDWLLAGATLTDLGVHRLKDLGRSRSSSCRQQGCRRSSRHCGRWATRRC
jgi:hypothetical protein